jgi:glutamate-1-semialdehyde 2,1-aminomutase
MSTIPEQIIGRYTQRTRASQTLTERARQVLPGGDTRTGVFYKPYPAYMVAGQGTTLTDLDGNQYLDFLNNYTSLVHGHAHPALLDAARDQLPNGSVYASPMQGQVELAELICARVPSVEQLRFTNSGTEATMLALRAARAYTGRDGIIKLLGSYHGSHDLAAARADPEADRGIPAGLRQDLFFAPFNDLAAMEALLQANEGKIAAMIVEPVPNAGGIPLPLPGYLQGLRDLADRYGALLIFDEVVTLRLHEGGYQALAGVTPVLTALGKILGGGFAVGAFGGKRAIMEQFNPERPDHLAHSGTFNGHSATMAAGLASLRQLEQAAINRIDALGTTLAQGFDDAFAEAGIIGSTTSVGSLVQVHWRSGPITTMADVSAGFNAAGDLPTLLHLELMNCGLYAAARGEYNTSTAMTEADITRAVDIFSAALHVLKPYVVEAYPALMGKWNR